MRPCPGATCGPIRRAATWPRWAARASRSSCRSRTSRISASRCAASCSCRSEGYEQARKIWNGSFDRHPALIARCAGAADVVQAVNFAQAHDLLTAVRGGGPQHFGAIDVRRRPRHRPVGDEGHPHRSGREDRRRRSRACCSVSSIARRRRSGSSPRSARHRTRASPGLTLGGGLGRLARRYGLSLRQPALGGHRHGRRQAAARERRARTRICTGPCAAAAATSAS